MAGEEAEARRLFAQEHRGQVAVAETDLAVVRDGAGDAERLEPDADRLGGLGGLLAALLQRDGGADGVRPAGVLEGDVLDALGDLVGVEAPGLADVEAFLDGLDTVLGQFGQDLRFATAVGFEKWHGVGSFLIPRGDRCS